VDLQEAVEAAGVRGDLLREDVLGRLGDEAELDKALVDRPDDRRRVARPQPPNQGDRPAYKSGLIASSMQADELSQEFLV